MSRRHRAYTPLATPLQTPVDKIQIDVYRDQAQPYNFWFRRRVSLPMRILHEALTFDDVMLQPAYSEVLPREVALETRLTRALPLNIPIISAATVSANVPGGSWISRNEMNEITSSAGTAYSTRLTK